MASRSKPPVYLNLLRIRQPVAALLSIGHRISGVILFLAIPFFVYLLELSLHSPADYTRVMELLGSGMMRWTGVLLIWLLAHHLYAGIRFLLIDMDLGLARDAARHSARVVFVAGFVTALLGAWWIF